MSRAFLIGAGATRAQYEKAPLSVDFFDKVSEKNGPLYDSIREAIFPFFKKHQDIRLLNVEDVMVLSEKFPISVQTSFLDSIYTSIYELLAEETQSTSEFIEKYCSNEIRMEPTLFKTLLNDPRMSEDDFFITLNYDLYLDREVYAFQNHIDYGIDKEIIGTFSGGDFTFKIEKSNKLSVYHLHGSMNWERLEDNRLRIHTGAISPFYRRGKCNLCIVPPGKKKLDGFIKPIWKIVEERILQADELILIGCSMNPEDKELCDLIVKFAINRDSKKIKIICLDEKIKSKEINESTAFELNNYNRHLTGDYKKYTHGFFINGPNGEDGALEFIFS